MVPFTVCQPDPLARPVSSTERFTNSCAECRKLIALQLEAREQLERALLQSPEGPTVAMLRDKVRKLAASTESEFMKAMAALSPSRS